MAVCKRSYLERCCRTWTSSWRLAAPPMLALQRHISFLSSTIIGTRVHNWINVTLNNFLICIQEGKQSTLWREALKHFSSHYSSPHYLSCQTITWISALEYLMDYIYERKISLSDVIPKRGKRVQQAVCDLVSECRMGDNNSETPQSLQPTLL